MQPFLECYKNPIISYITLLLMIIYVGAECLKNRELKVNSFMLYLIWALCVSLFMLLVLNNVNSTSVNRTISTIIYGMVIITFEKDKDLGAFLKTYEVFSMFCVIFFILQVIIFFLMRKAIVFQIPFLELKDNIKTFYQYMYNASNWGITDYVRFPGPLSEPSHYAAYIIPLAIMYLHGIPGYISKNHKRVFIIIVTICLSTAGTGIIIIAASLCVYVVIKNYDKKNFSKIPMYLLILVIMFFIVYLLNDSVSQTVNNLFVAQDSTTSAKADYRIYRSIAYFTKMPIVNKFFGIGLYNAEQFSAQNMIYTIYDSEIIYEYFNGIGQISIYTGVIGMCIYGIYIKKIFKKSSGVGKNMLVAYIMLIIATSNLFTGLALFYLAIIAFSRKNNMMDSRIKDVTTIKMLK